jgi:hypothetical protein
MRLDAPTAPQHLVCYCVVRVRYSPTALQHLVCYSVVRQSPYTHDCPRVPSLWWLPGQETHACGSSGSAADASATASATVAAAAVADGPPPPPPYPAPPPPANPRGAVIRSKVGAKGTLQLHCSTHCEGGPLEKRGEGSRPLPPHTNEEPLPQRTGLRVAGTTRQ